eukprot:m.109564 g.109564  ORF g.109564 m.109564 type:complete len:320 (+) comp14006_c0_seq1:117-1076(+)
MGAGCSSQRAAAVKPADIPVQGDAEYDEVYSKAQTQYERWQALRQQEIDSEQTRQEDGANRTEAECFRVLRRHFARAIPASVLVSECYRILERRGFDDDNTLFGSSVCPDLLRNSLVADFTEAWGENVSLGGLGGFPFLGKSGFYSLLDNVPQDGNIFILYCSHVGVNKEGVIGKINRMEDDFDIDCCRSAAQALKTIKEKDPGLSLSRSIANLDFQQGYVTKCILKETTRLHEADEPLVELPRIIYLHIRKFMNGLIPSDYNGKPLAFLGGVHVNTPPGVQDHFVPLNFELRNGEGVIEDLLPELDQVHQMSHVLKMI